MSGRRLISVKKILFLILISTEINYSTKIVIPPGI
jgi:hypothetical protein